MKTVLEQLGKHGKRKTKTTQILRDHTRSPHGQGLVHIWQHSGRAKGAKGLL